MPKAEIEAETARQTTDFLVGLFAVSDPNEALGNSITAREIMDKGAARIETELAAQPERQRNRRGKHMRQKETKPSLPAAGLVASMHIGNFFPMARRSSRLRGYDRWGKYLRALAAAAIVFGACLAAIWSMGPSTCLRCSLQ